MSRAADRPRPNPVWTLVVVAMIGLALAGPAIIVREQLADRVAVPSAAEGAQPPEGGGAEAAAGGTVKMAGLAFAPASLTVAKGATVVFDNDDTAPHTRSRPARAGSTRACSTRGSSSASPPPRASTTSARSTRAWRPRSP